MKKTIFLTVALLLTVLLLTACANTPESTSPSESKQGALQDNTYFGDGSGTGSVQQSTNSTAPGTYVPGTSVPDTSVPSTSVPSTSVPSTSAPDTSLPTTQPSTSPSGPNTSLTYEQFQALTGAEQRAYQESFENLDVFFEWYNAAKETYEKENPPIEIGPDGDVDLDDLAGGNG